MDTTVRTVTHTAGDQSWLGSQHGTDDCDPIVLDVSTFSATHYALGFIPSGAVLGKITASGLYGPYDADASNGLQTAVGHLFTDVASDGSTDVAGALFWHGEVVEANLPVFTGTDAEIDAAGKADLLGAIKYV